MVFHLKYVIDDDNKFVIFHKVNNTMHSDFKVFLGKIKSAGFLHFNRINGKFVCKGRSESLNVDSNPVSDSAFFTDFFRNKETCYIMGGIDEPFKLVFATNLSLDEFDGWDMDYVTNCANLDDIGCL